MAPRAGRRRHPPEWQALLPGRLLAELSQRLGGDGATCRLVRTAPHVVRLVTDVGTGEVVGADHEEFPVPSPFDEARELPPPLAVPALLLAELLEQALPAAAGEKDLERPHLATVRLQAEDATADGPHPEPAVTVRLQAVDGARIASSERTLLEQEIGGGERPEAWHDPRLSGPAGGVLLPLRAVRYLLPLLKRHGPGEEVLVDVLPADREATPNLLQLRLPARRRRVPRPAPPHPAPDGRLPRPGALLRRAGPPGGRGGPGGPALPLPGRRAVHPPRRGIEGPRPRRR